MSHLRSHFGAGLGGCFERRLDGGFYRGFRAGLGGRFGRCFRGRLRGRFRGHLPYRFRLHRGGGGGLGCSLFYRLRGGLGRCPRGGLRSRSRGGLWRSLWRSLRCRFARRLGGLGRLGRGPPGLGCGAGGLCGRLAQGATPGMYGFDKRADCSEARAQGSMGRLKILHINSGTAPGPATTRLWAGQCQ